MALQKCPASKDRRPKAKERCSGIWGYRCGVRAAAPQGMPNPFADQLSVHIPVHPSSRVRFEKQLIVGKVTL